MSGTPTIDATATCDVTPTIDARRAGVTAATTLLTGLGEVVVRVGNDQLGPFLREAVSYTHLTLPTNREV